MELRTHPFMSYRNIPSWPPFWVWIGGEENKHPKGEVGTLTKVKVVNGHPTVHRCFLWMEHEDKLYLGCLLLSDALFCDELYKLLQKNIGRPIEYVAGLDLG